MAEGDDRFLFVVVAIALSEREKSDWFFGGSEGIIVKQT